MTDQEIRELLARKCKEAGSQVAFAVTAGLSEPYVSDVLRGQRKAGPAMRAALKIRIVAVSPDELILRLSPEDVRKLWAVVSGWCFTHGMTGLEKIYSDLKELRDQQETNNG